MHIMEGYLPIGHAAGWWVASAPFLAHGVYSINRTLKRNPEAKLLLGASGGFAFVLSALKIPLPAGTCSHPTGIGLGAILFGPSVMTVLGTIVLAFQALLLAHGGLSTLGANAFSMAVVGAWAVFLGFHAARAVRLPFGVAVFVAAALGNLATYVMAAVQLALAHPDAASGFPGSLVKFLGIFAVPQVPLAIAEGMLTVVVMNALLAYNRAEIAELIAVPEEATPHEA